MKAESSLLLILIAAFFLTSCGAKKTAATLEVSASALTVSNTSFSGGLVIRGSSASGSFTIPIAAGTGSGNQITLDLPRDTWTFSAIGWEGDGAGAAPFAGNSKCGSQTVDLNRDEQTVNLNISYANCVSSTFGGANFRTDNAFDNLTVTTCGWLYTDSNGSSPVTIATASNYCQGPVAFDYKYKNYAKSLKFEVERNINGVVSPGISACVSSSTDGIFSLPHGFPETGLPLRITLFGQPNCPASSDSEISSFHFKDGLAATHADHDAVFGENDGAVKLFLPSFDTKRGYTSFLADGPKLFCAGTPCLDIPQEVTGGAERLIRSGRQFVLIPDPGTNQTCDKITSISTTGISPIPITEEIVSSCDIYDGVMYVSMNFDQPLSYGTLTVNFDGGDPFTLVLKDHDAYSEAHNFAWDILGYPHNILIIDPIKYSFSDIFLRRGKDAGLLTEVLDMFGPEGAGGVLGANLNCSTATAVNYISIFDEGFFKTYKVELQNVLPGAAPFVGDYLEQGGMSASDSFQKKILISRVSGSSNIGEIMIHFNCGDKIGRMESVHQMTGKVWKQLIEWNTQSAPHSRAREIRYEEENDNTRTTKISATYRFAENNTSQEVYAREWKLDISWDGNESHYQFHAGTSQVNVKNSDNGFYYIEASANHTDPSIENLDGIEYELNQAIASPTSQCVSKTAFATGDCSTPYTFSTEQYGGTSFNETDLTPTNIKTYFTSF